MSLLVKAFAELTGMELEAIFQLRQKVFMLEQQSLYLDIDGADQAARHFLWLDAEQLVGYSRLLPPGTTYDGPALGRLVVEKNYRGRGIADNLLLAMLEQAERDYPGQSLYLSAQLPQIPRYQQYGFIAYGEAYDDGGILHQDMQRLPSHPGSPT